MPKLSKAALIKSLQEIGAKRKTLVKPFKDDTPEKKKARIAKAKTDDFFFAKTYFPHYFEDKTPEFHKEWNDLSEIKKQPVLIAAPRGHAKSAFFSFLKPLKWIAFNQRHLIILGADTRTQAVNQLSFVMEELENNERLKSDFGEFKNPGAWADGEIVTKNGVMVVSRGSGQSLRGLRNGPHRPDAFVGDDIENDEEQKNPRRIEKKINWILRVVLPSMNPKGWSLVIVGSVLSRRSALAQLAAMKNPTDETSVFVYRIYRAIKENGEPLWAERFSLEYLDDLKTIMGSNAFNTEYMNDPKGDEGAFKEEWLAEWKEVDHIKNPPSLIVIFTDPSMGDTSKHDFKATIALGRVGNFEDVLAARIRQESVAAMIRSMFDLYERMKDLYPKARILSGIEDNGFQKLFLELVRPEEKERGYTLPLFCVTNLTNKDARIEAMSSPIERGIIRFCRNQTDQEILIEQLLYFESGSVKKDGPDALENAHRKLMSIGSGGHSYETLISRRKVFPNMGSRKELAGAF